MMKTKQRPDFFQLGIRALALFQIYLAYLVLLGAGFGFEGLNFTMKSSGGLILLFLSYLLWVGSGEVRRQTKLKVALGCLAVGLLPLLVNLPELVMGRWVIKDWILLAYFLTGAGAVLEMYWNAEENEN
jgi:hypothetical protein